MKEDRAEGSNWHTYTICPRKHGVTQRSSTFVSKGGQTDEGEVGENPDGA